MCCNWRPAASRTQGRGVELVLGPGALGAWAERGAGDLGGEGSGRGCLDLGGGEPATWWPGGRGRGQRTRPFTGGGRGTGETKPLSLAICTGKSSIGMPAALIVVDWDAVQLNCFISLPISPNFSRSLPATMDARGTFSSAFPRFRVLNRTLIA
jgi:hypothetical protein